MQAPLKFLSVLLFPGILALCSQAVVAQNERTDLLFCGASERRGGDLYAGLEPLNEINGCNPGSATRAMLVTRNGVSSISGLGSLWRAYLDNGGVIITEYTISEDVYNEIFGTALASGSTNGACNDNVMPVTRLNTDEPFWRLNDLPVTPQDDAGCGADLQPLVSAESRLVALGARDNGDISLAYRPQGKGVIFLAESDWQDMDAPITDASKSLMSAMIDAAPKPHGVPALPGWALGLLVLGLAAAARRFSGSLSRAAGPA